MSKYYKTKENVVFDTIVNLVMVFTLLVCFLPFVYMAALSCSGQSALTWMLTSRSSPTPTFSRHMAIPLFIPSAVLPSLC